MLSEIGEKVLKSRYSMVKPDGSKESWEELCKRVAKAVSSTETIDQQQRVEEEIFDTVYNRRFFPAGRILRSAGIHGENYLNCFVLMPEDSKESIANLLNNIYIIGCYGGGVGINFSNIRPKYSEIGNKRGFAPGIISVMEMVDSVGNHARSGGCVTGDTLIATDEGLKRIDKIVRDRRGMALTHKGFKNITTFFDNGEKPVWEVRTKRGYKVKASEDHKFKILNQDGNLESVELKDLQVGQSIPIAITKAEDRAPIQKLDKPIYVVTRDCTTIDRNFNLPEQLNSDFSYLLGFAYGNGSINQNKCLNLCVCNDSPEVIIKLSRIAKNEFGKDVRVYPGDGNCSIVSIFSRIFIEYLRVNKILKQKSKYIKVPDKILQSPNSVQAAFIAGYFDADGYCAKKTGYTISSISLDFLEKLQIILSQLGVASKVKIERKAIGNWNTLYKISVNGKEFRERFHNLIKDYSIKTKSLQSKRDHSFQYHSCTPKSLGLRCKDWRGRWTGNMDHCSYSIMTELLEKKGDSKNVLNLIEDQIISIEYQGIKNVYDLEVEDIHALSTDSIYTNNSRRSALLALVSIHHPDVIEFLQSKLEDGKLSNFNISVDITPEFTKAVIKDKKWEFTFRDRTYHRYSIKTEDREQIIFSPDFASAKEKASFIFGIDDPEIQKLDPIRAKDLWKMIVKNALEKAEPGLTNISLCNELNNGSYFENIVGVNPCSKSSTYVLTKDGYKTFGELSGQEVEIVNEKGNVVKSKIWSTGVKDTIDIKNSLGEVFGCTPDHVWKNIYGESVEAKDLRGHRLMPYLHDRELCEDQLFLKLGFIQGDGILGQVELKGILTICIGDKDVEIKRMFEKDGLIIKDRRCNTTLYNDILIQQRFSWENLPQRVLPKTYKDWTYEEKASFMRGLYSANGCVIRKHRVAFKSTCADLVLQIKESLKEDFDIDSYITTNKPTEVTFSNGTYLCKESYDLNISRCKEVWRFYKKIGFIQQYKEEHLYELCLLKSPKIMSIKDTGKEEVFDFTEPETHWGVVEGYIAHNCAEYNGEAYSVCDLGSLNLPEFVKDGKIDYELLKKTIYTAVRILDNVLDVTTFVLPEIKEKATRSRNVGIGVMGLHHMFMDLGLAYGSDECFDAIDEVFSFIRDSAYEASSDLAQEKGSFPAFSSYPYCKGKFFTGLPRKLKSKIRKQGMRNNKLLALQPSGTIHNLAGNQYGPTSSGIEPISGRVFIRDDAMGRRTIVDPKLKELILAGKDTSHVNTTSDLDPADHLKVQAAIQNYIDNSISKTILIDKDWVPPDGQDEVEYMAEMLMEYLPELKGTTLYKDGSRAGQIITLIPHEEEEKYIQEALTEEMNDKCRSGVCEL